MTLGNNEKREALEKAIIITKAAAEGGTKYSLADILDDVYKKLKELVEDTKGN